MFAMVVTVVSARVALLLALPAISDLLCLLRPRLERRDPLAPGKPQAVGWALRQLALGDYDACVIVDADTVVDRAFARALARWAPLRGKLLQACERPLNETDSWLTRLAGLLARRRG